MLLWPKELPVAKGLGIWDIEHNFIGLGLSLAVDAGESSLGLR